MPVGVATQIVLFLFAFAAFKKDIQAFCIHFRGILVGILVGIFAVIFHGQFSGHFSGHFCCHF